MILIQLNREPVTIPLTGAYAGVTVTLRRLTSVHFAIARHAAQVILEDDGKLLILLSEYDLLPKGSVKEWRRLRDKEPVEYAAFLTGIRMWLVAVECGLLGIESWSGIGGVTGGADAPTGAGGRDLTAPAAISREALQVLMQDEAYSQQIMDGLDSAARILRTEGKP